MAERRPPRAALTTVGCRVNFSETDQLRGQLQAAGYLLVDFEQEADLYVVNTCTVTHVADRKSRQLLRRAARRNPGALVIAVGCYADVAPDVLREVQGVHLVVGREDEPRLAKRLAEVFPWVGGEHAVPACPEQGRLAPAHPTRALIKVQDGCDHRCAYCIVSTARGPSRSRPADQVLTEVRHVEQLGFREVIITGVNLGVYNDPQTGDLANLARRILQETGIARVRFSSIEPQDFPRGLLDLWPEGRLCRHFHLPLQSGCDRTLARMERQYRLADYQELLAEICRRVPDVGLTTDIVVGFPGETEQDFEQSLTAISTLPFSGLHIFPFSARPGTAAAVMPDHVPSSVRGERCKQMHYLARKMARSFRRRFLGRELAVLWDGRSGQGWSGLSDNYLRVVATGEGNYLGQITWSRIIGLDGLTLGGEVIAAPTPWSRPEPGAQQTDEEGQAVVWSPGACPHSQTGQIVGFVV